MIERGVIGFLSLTSDELEPGLGLADDWDLVLITASWEQRTSAALPHLKDLDCEIGIIRFSSTDAAIKAKKDAFVAHAQSALKRTRLIEFPASNATEESFRAIAKLFEERFAQLRRPMRVLMDVSSIPKKYLLYVLGMGFKREFVASMTFLYAEARYEALPTSATPLSTNPAGLISDGEWTSVQVPFLEADNYAPSKRDVVVSLGAEIGVAIPTIERLEPRKLTLIKVSDPMGRVPKALVDKEKRYVDTLLQQPGATLREHGLHDVLAVAQDVLKSCESTTTCLAIGSKPHALGLGLAALADDRIDVVCRTPSSYKGADALPTGKILRFVIADRFEPSTYLKPEKSAK